MTESLATLALTQFTQLVNAAFKNYNSVLALARSPLANSPLIVPLLVLDDVSPTANERGNALRLVLLWATNKMAPEPLQYPIGHHRPLDDPTWRDPRWWRYNILRHRYLEPLHPDEFVEGGRFTETLVALTGIPSADTFFDERNRAIREVTQWLQQQLQHRQADDELKQLALDEIHLPLLAHSAAYHLLKIAATFEDVFPRTLLLHMAAEESVSKPDEALDFLVAQRYLLVEDSGSAFLVPPILRAYIYLREGEKQLRFRHKLAAVYLEEAQEPIKAATHYLRACFWEKAANILMHSADDLVNELNTEDLCEVLEKFSREHLPDPLWRELQIMLSDLLVKSGRQENALLACRRALKSSTAPTERARVYRRMGKLYEKHNQFHALGYYQQAFERFSRGDPELLDLLKDRAWLYILRQEWTKAESDLELALSQVPTTASEQQADLYDALATLHRHQKQFDPALRFARKALALREETGNLGRIAWSFGNLGLLYTDLGEFANAIAAYSEAMTTFQLLGNQDAIATTLLNMGIVRHLSGQIEQAVDSYQQSVKLSQQIELPLAEVRARYNLAEALSALDRDREAQQHWHLAYRLSERCGFDDELADLEKLRTETPALRSAASPADLGNFSLSPAATILEPEEKAILQLAEERGQITTKVLMENAHVSKATASRRLARLLELGLIQKHGKGRSTCYSVARQEGIEATESRREASSHRSLALPSRHELRRKLQPHRNRLRRDFSVEGLGLLQSVRPEFAPSRLLVHFGEEPDLSRFFELEQMLINELDVDIDLILVDSARYAQLVKAVDMVHWLD